MSRSTGGVIFAHMAGAIVRKIIHIDMDAFYASIEQRDHPEYKGKPVAVGGLPEGRGGVVAAASYEARKYGVRSAMPSKQAQKLCPQLIFVRPRFEVYKEESRKIRNILHRFTDVIEPLSLDEAYLDVTNDKQNIGSAIDIAKRIKEAIQKELNLTASAGISTSKFVAKVASDFQKPNGLTFIGPSRIEEFMEKLPVEKFHGVGKVTAARMKRMGLFKGADLKRLSESELVHHFGKAGRFYFKIVRGIDDREVKPHRRAKSVGAEDTFSYDLTDREEMRAELARVAVLVRNRMSAKSLAGKTITIKIKYHDFHQITRSKTLPEPVSLLDDIIKVAHELLANADVDGKKVRLLGVSVSNFDDEDQRSGETVMLDQLRLF